MKHPHEIADDELRVAVAVEVMGWQCAGKTFMTGAKARIRGIPPHDGEYLCVSMRDVPDYPRDWSAAGAVAEKMHDLSFDVKVNFHQGWALPVQVEVSTKSKLFGLSRADTAPRAICEAALLAVRAKGGE